jgi:hypothetical protein
VARRAVGAGRTHTGEQVAEGSTVRMRIIRDNDAPASNPHDDAYVFGLQDTKQEIVAGARRADGGEGRVKKILTKLLHRQLCCAR